ncbi:hypothetical protein NPIL_341031 [Nephila pilipes]|uniref:Uncharacterized protein n=1 Tax=Nephila pilipes TaxID=299642 RepID=A0A8X6UK44_NEPPI|nr:hypothetical protein NPIL_341031 [Nephila pilipes]
MKRRNMLFMSVFLVVFASDLCLYSSQKEKMPMRVSSEQSSLPSIMSILQVPYTNADSPSVTMALYQRRW